MSKNINEICSRVLQTNHELYSGSSELIKDMSILKRSIKDIEKKIDQILNILVQSVNER
jgi:hypothetical protein